MIESLHPAIPDAPIDDDNLERSAYAEFVIGIHGIGEGFCRSLFHEVDNRIEALQSGTPIVAEYEHAIGDTTFRVMPQRYEFFKEERGRLIDDPVIRNRAQALANYPKFQDVVGAVLDEVQRLGSHKAVESSYVAEGSTSDVHRVQDKERGDLAVRFVRNPNSHGSQVDRRLSTAGLFLDNPRIEQVYAGNYESGVTISSFFTGETLFETDAGVTKVLIEQLVDDVWLLSGEGVRVDGNPANLIRSYARAFRLIDLARGHPETLSFDRYYSILEKNFKELLYSADEAFEGLQRRDPSSSGVVARGRKQYVRVLRETFDQDKYGPYAASFGYEQDFAMGRPSRYKGLE